MVAFKKTGSLAYLSSCGQFKILNMGSSCSGGQWVLFVSGNPTYQKTFTTLRQAKHAATRYARGGPSVA